MRRLFLFCLTLTFAFFSFCSPVSAQSSKPAFVMSPDANVQVGAIKELMLSMVNMGVPLKRVEVTVRLSGDFDQDYGFSFNQADTERYGLRYESHYFTDFAGRKDVQDLVIVFNATDPQGYNQGSAQVPLAYIRYKAVLGNFAAMIIPERSKLTDNTGSLLAGMQTFGTTNYRAEQVAASPFVSYGLNSYSLSFHTDPVKMWWPTAANTVQQIDAGIWKDSDGDKVKQFTNLSAEWQVDSNYIEIMDTSSSFSKDCASVRMADGRPCIHFAAHAKTKKPGRTDVTLRVTDTTTGEVLWNSYPVEVYELSTPVPTPVSTTPPSKGTPTPSPMPSFLPEDKVSTEEFEAVQQKVTYLQSQVEQQQKELERTQSVLSRITSFLRKLFGF